MYQEKSSFGRVSILPEQRKPTEVMDAERNSNLALQYLCRMEEAKDWMVTIITAIFPFSKYPDIKKCIESLPPAGPQFSDSLRDGVVLALMSIALSKIRSEFKLNLGYELNNVQDITKETIIKTGAPIWKHNDNINIFFKLLKEVRMPVLFVPETTDIYDAKNIPRLIYCIHSLAFLLTKLGLPTPSIDDHNKENVDWAERFSPKQISDMEKALRNLGILENLPKFEKIGTTLNKALNRKTSTDKTAAILAINLAIDNNDVDKFKKCQSALEIFSLDEYSDYDSELLKSLQEEKLQKTCIKNDEDDDEFAFLTETEIDTASKVFYLSKCLSDNDKTNFDSILSSWYPDRKITKGYWSAFRDEFEQMGELSKPAIDDLADFQYECELKADNWRKLEKSGLLSKFQAAIRGKLIRTNFQERLLFLKMHEKEVVKIQRFYRLYCLKKRADHFIRHEDKIVKLQQCFREFKKKKQSKLSKYAVVIQRNYRAHRMKEAYNDMKISSFEKPVRIVNLKFFIDLYEKSNVYQLENEIKTYKSKILDQINRNKESENLCSDIDKKISLQGE